MMDIVSFEDGLDLGIQDSIVPKAANLLQVQLGSLDYAPDFGVDLRYFITSNFQFQNETFKSYLIERMMQNQINVADVTETLDTLFETFGWSVGEAAAPVSGFIK